MHPPSIAAATTSGISTEGDIIDLAIAAKLVDKTGTWLRFGEVHLGQGREKARQFLKDNPEVAEEIRQKIVDGKLNKWLEEVVLLKQAHVNPEKHDGRSIEEIRAEFAEQAAHEFGTDEAADRFVIRESER